MRLTEILGLVEKLYFANFRAPILLVGAPGVGKSEMVRELGRRIAEKRGMSFRVYKEGEDYTENDFVLVELNATHVEPSDLQGFPRQVGNVVEYVPLRWANVLARCAGILFIDEVTNVVRNDVRSALLKVVLEKKVGFTELNKDVLIVCAGNTLNTSTMAQELSEPELNRYLVIEVSNDVESWKEYMDRTVGQWDRRVYVFLKKYGEYFIMKPKDSDRMTYNGFGSPRAWTTLAKVSSLLSGDELLEVSVGIVGREAGTAFTTFVSVQVPDLETITEQVWQGLGLEQKYLVITQLYQLLRKELQENRVGEVAERLLSILVKEKNRELSALLLSLLGQEVLKLVKVLKFSHPFVQMAKDLSKLVVKVK